MDLWGITYEYTYTWPSEKVRCTSENASLKRDEREIFPWSVPNRSRRSLPWRQSTYTFPCQVSQDSGKAEGGQVIQQQKEKAEQPRSAAQNTTTVNTSANPCRRPPVTVPFRRVLVGGSFRLLPEREAPRAVTFDPCPNKLAARNTEEEKSQPPRAASERKPPALPVVGRDPDLPMTPPLGRAAQLHAFINARTEEAHEAGAIKPPCFPSSPYYLARQPAKTSAETTEKVDQSQFTTPMSQFPRDKHVIEQAVRTYKRDIELQKERHTYDDPMKLKYQGEGDWYNMMMLQETPSLDARNENELLQADYAPIPDGLGGTCYILPKKEEQEKNRPAADKKEYPATADKSFTSPRCQDIVKSSFQPTGIKQQTKQQLLNKEIEHAIVSVNRAANEKYHKRFLSLLFMTYDRDTMYAQLADTEESMHRVKEVYYSMPYEERRKDTDILQRLHTIEKTQKSLLEAIGSKGRELSDLLKHQHALECHLAYHATQDKHQ